jgi:hypothetical protein
MVFAYRAGCAAAKHLRTHPAANAAASAANVSL